MTPGELAAWRADNDARFDELMESIARRNAEADDLPQQQGAHDEDHD